MEWYILYQQKLWNSPELKTGNFNYIFLCGYIHIRDQLKKFHRYNNHWYNTDLSFIQRQTRPQIICTDPGAEDPFVSHRFHQKRFSEN